MKFLFSYVLLILLTPSLLVAGPMWEEQPNPAATPKETIEQNRNQYDPLSDNSSSADNSSNLRRESTLPGIAETETSHRNRTMENVAFSSSSSLDLIGRNNENAELKDSPRTPVSKESSVIQETPISDYKLREDARDNAITDYNEARKEFETSQTSHLRAVSTALNKEKTLIKRLTNPLQSHPLSACFFSPKISRSQQAVAAAADQLAANYNQLHAAVTQLGYHDPNDLCNQADYSEKTVSLGEENYPEQGVFTLGQETRDQLKAVHQNHFLELLQTEPNSEKERTMFAEMSRDLPRATFILKTAPSENSRIQPAHEKLLFDHQELESQLRLQPSLSTAGGASKASAAKIVEEEETNESTVRENITRELQAKGISQFKEFTGDRAFQLAIGSLMYQAGNFDLESMKYGVSRDADNDLAPFFTEGLQSVRQLQDVSKIRVGTKPKEQIFYSLEKSPDVADEFQLTLFNSIETERIHSITQQEFTLHTADVLIYTFQRNPLFNSNAPLSLDNSPIIITCTGGQLLHQLTPLEGVRPPPPDTISLSAWESLTREQQENVITYQAAESSYVAAKENWASRLNYLAVHPNFGSLISLEKAAAEQRLQSLRRRVQEVASPVVDEPATAPFLERNVITPQGKTFDLPLLDNESEKIALPEQLSFLGGRELQRTTTDQLKSALTTSFNSSADDTALTAAAKKIRINTERVFPALLANSSDEEARQRLIDFTENNKVAKSVALLVQDPAASLAPQLLQEPLLGDALRHLSDAKATSTFFLEKKLHASSEDPLFILKADYHLPLTIALKEDEGNISRTLDIHFVYALKVNPHWDYSELTSLSNLPVEARCVGIHIDQEVEHGF